MKKILFLILLSVISGCATKRICQNQTENLRAIYDVEDSCRVRIRQVIVGSSLNIPRSIDFKSGIFWTYTWVESKFENGKLSLGHYVLMPEKNEQGQDD